MKGSEQLQGCEATNLHMINRPNYVVGVFTKQAYPHNIPFLSFAPHKMSTASRSEDTLEAVSNMHNVISNAR